MRKFTIFLSVLLSTAFNSIGQTPRNCSQILALNPSSASGVYTIDPDGTGVLPSMNCYCDMTTNGGGWTLVMNYNHLTATSPAVKILTNSLPLQGATTLGFDESTTQFWGHAGTALMSAIPFDEVRFYGITSAHKRVLNFKTFHTGTVSYFKTGIGSTEGIKSNFSPLANHTAFLPAAIDQSATNKGNYAMTDYPLWTTYMYHWYLGGVFAPCSSIRWEVDDYPCSILPSTFHQIWVRQSSVTGLNNSGSSGMQLSLWPNPASNVINLGGRKGNNTPLTLNIYNNIGQLLRSELLSNIPHPINVADLSNGIYLLEIRSKEYMQHQKLIIQR